MVGLAAEEGQPWPPSECLMCLRPLITHKQEPLVSLYHEVMDRHDSSSDTYKKHQVTALLSLRV